MGWDGDEVILHANIKVIWRSKKDTLKVGEQVDLRKLSAIGFNHKMNLRIIEDDQFDGDNLGNNMLFGPTKGWRPLEFHGNGGVYVLEVEVTDSKPEAAEVRHEVVLKSLKVVETDHDSAKAETATPATPQPAVPAGGPGRGFPGHFRGEAGAKGNASPGQSGLSTLADRLSLYVGEAEKPIWGPLALKEEEVADLARLGGIVIKGSNIVLALHEQDADNNKENDQLGTVKISRVNADKGTKTHSFFGRIDGCYDLVYEVKTRKALGR